MHFKIKALDYYKQSPDIVHVTNFVLKQCLFALPIDDFCTHFYFRTEGIFAYFSPYQEEKAKLINDFNLVLM